MFKTLPKLFIGAAALIIVISGVALCSKNFLSESSASIKINIGLVVEDDSYWTNLGINAVLKSNSTSMINFIQTDEASVKEMISNGEIIAGIILPEKIASSIISGENTPITILYPENSGLEAVIITELTQAAARILSSFQAAVYSAEDFCYEYSTVSVSKNINKKLNMYFLGNALSRESLFNEINVDSYKNISPDRYYIASALVLFMMIFGILLNGYYDSISKTTEDMFKRMGLSFKHRLFIQTITTALALSVIIYPLITVAIIIVPDFFTMNILLFLCAIAVCIIISSLFTGLIYHIFGTGITGILALFGLSIITGLMCGLFIPASLLPDFLTNIGSFTPAGFIFNILIAAIK